MSYFDQPQLSSSQLKCFAGDYYSQRQAVHRWKHFTSTKAVELGSAIHHGIENIGSTLDVGAYAEFFQSLKTEKSRLSNAAEVQPILDAFKEQLPLLAQKVAQSPGQCEVEFYTDDEKCKVDFIDHDEVMDWKSTSDVSYWGIFRKIRDLHYDLQAYHYLKVTGASKFTFYFIQTSAPYEVVKVPATPDMIEKGRLKWIIAKSRLDSYLAGETEPMQEFVYGEDDDEF